MSRRLSVNLLGNPQFLVGDKRLRTNSRKAEALLCYACLHPDKFVSREVLANLLWSEKSEDNARSSLRQTIFVLNKAFKNLGFSGFSAGKSTVSLEPESFKTDISDLMESVLAGGTPHQRFIDGRLQASDLLQGMDDLDAQFDVWLSVQRQVIHDRLRNGLEQKLSTVLDESRGLAIAEAILNLDPSHEPACRYVMTVRAQRSDSAGALRSYNSLWKYLDVEFDIEPTPETQGLVADIKLGRIADLQPAVKSTEIEAITAVSTAVEIGASSGNFKPRIFIDEVEVQILTGDRSFAASVFRHDLISRMVRFREWSVIDSPANDSSTVVSELAYRLRSSVLVENENLALALTLSDAATGRVIWADNYQTDISSLFRLQPKIVARIATGANVNVTSEQLERCAAQAEISLDYYDRWLKGQFHHFRHRPEDFEQAVILYNSLIEALPTFAPGYSSLAQTYNSRHLVFVGETRDTAVLEQARHLSQSAQNIDPFDSRSHLAAAWNSMLLGRFDEAENNLRLAYDLNENDPWTAVSVATGLALCGKPDAADPLARRAVDLEIVTTPVQWSYLTALFFIVGNYPAAASAFAKSLPGYFGADPWGVAALVAVDEIDEAKQRCGMLLDNAVRRWTRQEKPTPARVADWVSTCYPLALVDPRERLMAALGQAGLTAN